MRPHRIWQASYIALLCCVQGCGGPKNPQHLYGHYRASIESGTADLVLLPGSVYRQVVQIPQRHFYRKVTGQWIYYPAESRINFTEFINNDQFSDPAKDIGFSSLPVEREYLIGRIRIGSEEDNPYLKLGSIW